jgi:hypothetical protein
MDSSVNSILIAQHIKDRIAKATSERSARELRPAPTPRPTRRLRLRRLRRRVAV